jgi:drug/metabolite transporter (DMT)-like permease
MPFRQELVQLDCLFWLCAGLVFLGTTWIASKEGVKHMPALQLAAIRQFIGGFIYIAFSYSKNTLAQRETMENHIYSEYR